MPNPDFSLEEGERVSNSEAFLMIRSTSVIGFVGFIEFVGFIGFVELLSLLS
jgi:hypothetical protein